MFFLKTTILALFCIMMVIVLQATVATNGNSTCMADGSACKITEGGCCSGYCSCKKFGCECANTGENSGIVEERPKELPPLINPKNDSDSEPLKCMANGSTCQIFVGGCCSGYCSCGKTGCKCDNSGK